MAVQTETSKLEQGKLFLPSRCDGDVLCTKLSRTNVIRTQHLRYQRGKAVQSGRGGTTRAHLPERRLRCRGNRQQAPRNRPLWGERLSESRCPGLRSWTICPDLLSTGPDKTGRLRSRPAWCWKEKVGVKTWGMPKKEVYSPFQTVPVSPFSFWCWSKLSPESQSCRPLVTAGPVTEQTLLELSFAWVEKSKTNRSLWKIRAVNYSSQNVLNQKQNHIYYKTQEKGRQSF